VIRSWVALLDEPPEEADAVVPVQLRGGAAVLARWTGRHHPHPRALAIDPRAVGSDGPPMSVSWLALEQDSRPLFDDPEVVEARRVLLRQWPSYGASTLVADAVRLAGSVLFHRPGERRDDPFARLGPTKAFATQGFFVPVPAPTGPALERYGGMPWPFDRFPA
jgi:hypothetical protein